MVDSGAPGTQDLFSGGGLQENPQRGQILRNFGYVKFASHFGVGEGLQLPYPPGCATDGRKYANKEFFLNKMLKCA